MLVCFIFLYFPFLFVDAYISYFYKANNAIGYIYYPSSTIESSLQDWAFVVWNTNTVYSTGCYGMKGDGYNGMAVSTVGYPQDLDSGNYMYKCSGTITSCNDYDFWSDLRVYKSQNTIKHIHFLSAIQLVHYQFFVIKHYLYH